MEALLVAIGAPRLRRLGITVSDVPSAEHRLYELLARTDPDSAHGRYNALLRRLTSFVRAMECGCLTDLQLLEAFMRRLGELPAAGSVYFTGGATALLFGWRASTIDADLMIEGEVERLLQEFPRLKEELQMNVELASPAEFIPELPGWRDRSVFIARHGQIDFYHYDPYAQALAKLERGHAMDLADVREMISRGLVDRREALRLFGEIEPVLYRYPAIDPGSFRRRVEELLAED